MMESLFEDRENLKDFLEEAELQQYHELFRDILKISKVSQLKFVAIEDLTHIGLSKPEQRRYKKIYSKHFPNPYILKIKKFLSSNKRNDNNGQNQVSLPLEFPSFAESNVKVPTKHIISIEDISINKELGMGQFGVVQQGTWSTGNQRLQVAIKCLGHERMTSNSTEFLKEAAVMHSIEHPNVVRLYGVVLHIDSLMLFTFSWESETYTEHDNQLSQVTELAPLRSLLECLREISLRPNFPVQNLCEFAEQICSGMTYLENKRLIHRDLAARNILVFNKDLVKISDFGLSRALGVGKDYYQTNYNVNLKLPVAWCAPECILYLRFTSASDVWAFGVCLWEMFTYGFQPWAAFSGQQILEAIDSPNFQRLERPECCPDTYYLTMLECWSHDPADRPKFKDLGLMLREKRPELMIANANYKRAEEGRRHTFLEYKAGQIITVLGKEDMTKNSFWYGVLPGGAVGLFDPNNTKPYIKPQKPSLPCNVLGTLTPTVATRRSSRLNINSLLRSDVKRHTYSGKRNIERSMISSPQGEVRHTGHVGLDGAYFGDLSFLDPAGCPPRQVVQPYRPSEDVERLPLINPSSPSYLAGNNSTPPYPMLSPREPEPLPRHFNQDQADADDMNRRNTASTPTPRPCAGQSSFDRQVNASTSKATTTEHHEYHEISSENETESTTLELKQEHSDHNDAISVATKSSEEFSSSMMDEIEFMFRNGYDKSTGDRHSINATGKPHEDGGIRSATLSKLDRKKEHPPGTMKPMSAHDEKTLETACAMANEITTKSMNDLDTKIDAKPGHSPTERPKPSFRTLVSSIQNHYYHSHEAVPKDANNGKPERRNFSDEARSVPDIQASLTEDSIQAYTSLIEQPTPSTSLMSYITTESTVHREHSMMPHRSSRLDFEEVTIGELSYVPPHLVLLPRFESTRHEDFEEVTFRVRESTPCVASTSNSEKKTETSTTKYGQAGHDPNKQDVKNRQKTSFLRKTFNFILNKNKQKKVEDSPSNTTTTEVNVMPLPPRATKPKLVDKPRHFRKYPLLMPGSAACAARLAQSDRILIPPIKDDTPEGEQSNIYQNLIKLYHPQNKQPKKQDSDEQVTIKKEHDDDQKVQYQNLSPDGVAVHDGVDNILANALQDMPSTSTATNPFETLQQVKEIEEEGAIATTPIDSGEERSLVKDCNDHVSVEDLLEFADLKPCGRQRGAESDEVRIMRKVFKEKISSEHCVNVLEICGWNIYDAIKLERVRVAAGQDADIELCKEALRKAEWDTVKASAAVIAHLKAQQAQAEDQDESTKL